MESSDQELHDGTKKYAIRLKFHWEIAQKLIHQLIHQLGDQHNFFKIKKADKQHNNQPQPMNLNLALLMI